MRVREKSFWMGLQVEHLEREEYSPEDTGWAELCPFLVGGEAPLAPSPGTLETEVGDIEMVLPRAVAGWP